MLIVRFYAARLSMSRAMLTIGPNTRPNANDVSVSEKTLDDAPPGPNTLGFSSLSSCMVADMINVLACHLEDDG